MCRDFNQPVQKAKGFKGIARKSARLCGADGLTIGQFDHALWLIISTIADTGALMAAFAPDLTVHVGRSD
jgi:hypothetical protein